MKKTMVTRAKRMVRLKCHIPLDAVPKSISRRMKRAEKYINSLGVHIDKIQMPSSSASPSESVSLSQEEFALVVGSVQQYPQMSHFNEAMILRMFGKDRLSRNSWSFDSTVTQGFGTAMFTAIDHYPFTSKFGKWKVRRRGHNMNRRDSFNEQLPRLTRNGQNRDQELVIYRDVPYDLQSAISVIPILNEYNPDVVVLEYGRIPFVDQLLLKHASFSKLTLPLKKILALLTPTRTLQLGLGKSVYAVSKRYYKNELSSYALESTLNWAMKKGEDGPPLIFGDLHHKITDTLRVFNDYLDLWNVATLQYHGLIDERMVRASSRVHLGDTVANVIQTRLNPHMTAMNVYRNDVLSAVINELSPEKYSKILLISQAMRLRDLTDKLCGKSKIEPWIKEMDGDHVLMHHLNPYQYKRGSTNAMNTYLSNAIESERREELAKCCSYLGHRGTAFLMLPYPLGPEGVTVDMNANDLNEGPFVEEIKCKLTEIEAQLKQKF